MSAWLAEPGGLQVQAALKLLAGGLADGAVVVEPGEFGVLGGIEVTAQFPVGQAVRFRCLGAVDAGAGAPDPGLQAGPGPVDHVIGSAVAGRELIEPGQGRLGQAQPGHGLFMARVRGPGDPGPPDQRFEGEPLHDERDHDHRGGEPGTGHGSGSAAAGRSG